MKKFLAAIAVIVGVFSLFVYMTTNERGVKETRSCEVN